MGWVYINRGEDVTIVVRHDQKFPPNRDKSNIVKYLNLYFRGP